MASQAVASRNTITLKGSAQIVSEFFHHAVNRWAPLRGSGPVPLACSMPGAHIAAHAGCMAADHHTSPALA